MPKKNLSKRPLTGPEAEAVFAAASYRELIRVRIAAQNGARGYQRRLAEAANCKPSYLSQVLNSHVHLTLDQAAGLAEFWGLSEDEADYFLTLLSLERSSAPAFRRLLEARLHRLLARHRRVSERVYVPVDADAGLRADYYATWYMPAIHVLLSIEKLRTPAALSAHLGLPVDLVTRSLARLGEMGLVVATKTGFQPSEKNLHLDQGSPLIHGYHANWRQQASLRAQMGGTGEVHYTGLYVMGEKDAAALRDLLLKTIERSRAMTVAATEETTAVALVCDLFRF